MAKQILDLSGSGITTIQPHYFGWIPIQQQEIIEVFVFCKNVQAFGLGESPNGVIIRRLKIKILNMGNSGKQIAKPEC
ncbi:MAG: hypothetical protein ABMA02_02915 [Saprospiraceae bacterium]